MTLFEKYKPDTLSRVVGHAPIIASLERIMYAPEFTGGAFAFIGASGTGKDSIAGSMIADLGIDDADIFEVGGSDCTVDMVRDIRDKFSLSTWGPSGWKACRVPEFHGMTPKAVQAWLPLLESLPKKRLVIFTSTESFEADMFGNFTAPLASRCKVFELEVNLEAAAAHLAAVATKENLNGQPIAAYRELLARCAGNLRMALQKIECGEMLKPVSPAAQIVARFSAPSPAIDATAGPVPVVASDEVAAALAMHAKFCKGSKKWFKSVERLQALGVSV